MANEKNDWDAYCAGLEAGKKHSSSSPDTIKRFESMDDKITKMEIKMTKFEGKLEKIETKLDDHAKQQKEDFDSIKGSIKALQNFVIGALIIFALASLYLIFSHVGLPT